MADISETPSQRAREAAAEFGRYVLFSDMVADGILEGRHADNDLVQAFARFERDCLDRPSQWRDIATAPKDGTRIWAAFHPGIYPRLKPNRDDLASWNGLQLTLRHPGIFEDAGGQPFDVGWNVAAPVGHGGFPDEWIAGWMPLPPPPAEAGAEQGEKGNTPQAPAERVGGVAKLREAARDLLAGMSSTYRARNGREVGIEADDGEKCWIVHSDLVAALEAALQQTEGSDGR